MRARCTSRCFFPSRAARRLPPKVKEPTSDPRRTQVQAAGFARNVANRNVGMLSLKKKSAPSGYKLGTARPPKGLS